ncbi:Rne/Rng family ribonuclease [Ilumatobacter sp.]|uniref:Rne/Rng family ribonuclease n=3 Tax=Ilumatobacter sp. TaxID=1967498 RepID=UPI00329A0FAF
MDNDQSTGSATEAAAEHTSDATPPSGRTTRKTAASRSAAPDDATTDDAPVAKVPAKKAATRKSAVKKAASKTAPAEPAAAKKAVAKRAATPKSTSAHSSSESSDAVPADRVVDPDRVRGAEAAGPVGGDSRNDVELPDKMSEGRPSAEASERALVRKPRIGDTMPVPSAPPPGPARDRPADADDGDGPKRRRRGGKGRSGGGSGAEGKQSTPKKGAREGQTDGPAKKRGRSRGKGRDSGLDDQALIEQRKGRERNGKPIGRYFMCVQVRPGMAQVAVMEGRNLIEHYVSRPADDVAQIHGNIYVGKVQNVLPGMEAAFVDITTPKNAVLYRGDVQYDPADIEVKGKNPRIEDILKNRQLILCQVTKNPIAHKGARLTQEVSLPGRFVVLIPNSKTYGISKRLPDDVRKRLRNILDRVKPDEHGLIVRTAAENATEAELVADMTILLKQWDQIEQKAAKAQRPALLSREPELAVRVIREEFSTDYRGVLIDDFALFEEVRDYVQAFNPELADRIEFYDADKEGLSLFERHHVHEQVHKALDRKVWLPSGGSLIIEHTEALTVIDVNTGKNVGKSNLEETVFHNNMEAAVEVAKQLRLRDIGGIIVIDFIDMEIRENRAKVVGALRDGLARDKTRSQVFDIGELGLVEMTRKRIGEGLLTEFSEICPDCDGRGVKVDHSLLE